MTEITPTDLDHARKKVQKALEFLNSFFTIAESAAWHSTLLIAAVADARVTRVAEAPRDLHTSSVRWTVKAGKGVRVRTL